MPSNVLFDDELSCDVRQLWNNALSAGTRACYNSGLQCFLSFIRMQGISFMGRTLPPISEDILIHFVTHCNKRLKLKYDTIKLYLAGVRFHYIRNNLGDPLAGTLRLSYILRAIKKSPVVPSPQRFPITSDVLIKLCAALNTNMGLFSPFTALLLQCVFKTAFYGFMRCGEFTCKTLRDTNFIHMEDVTLLPDKSCFHLRLRSSKTDPYGRGVVLKIFENHVLTPVLTMSQYLDTRYSQGATKSSPLFVEDHVSSPEKPLSRPTFISYLKESLTRVGVDCRAFNGHSFRIGAATSAAAAGIEDHVIQTLGRWSSNCYIRYIRTNPSTILHAQHTMSVCQ